MKKLLIFMFIASNLFAQTQIDLSRRVKGTLPQANGGTGKTTWTASRCVRIDALGVMTEAAADCGTGGGVSTVTASTPLASSGGANPDISLTGVVGLSNGGTNQNSWTSSRCVQVNAGGTALESASAACGSASVTSVTASSPLASSGGGTPDISLTGTIPIGNGGTNATSFTGSRCVQSNAGGTALESAAAACGSGSGSASVPIMRRWGSLAPAGNGSDITLSSVGDFRPGTSGTVAHSDPTASDPYPHQTYTTTTTNGSFAGLRGGLIWRTGTNLYGFSTFRISATSAIRFWAALTDQTGGTMGASDDPAGNYVGIRFSTSAGDSNFQCISKDNTTQSIATNPLVAGDANSHTMEIIADDAIPNYIIKIDGTQACDTLTSNLPTTGTNLNIVIGVTCLSCSPTAKVLYFGRWYGEADY